MRALVGVWGLIEWQLWLDGERGAAPFGGLVDGRLIYCASGHMSATLSARDRGTVGTATLAQASEADRARAASSYVAYLGTYRVEGDRVIHSVVMSLHPDWVGSEQVRTFELEGARPGTVLHLSTTPILTPSGRRAVNRLSWRLLDQESP